MALSQLEKPPNVSNDEIVVYGPLSSRIRAFMDETLILLNRDDCQTGSTEKLYIHQQGILHPVSRFRGANCYSNKALGKYHSQGLRTNNCCGHPLSGENCGSGKTPVCR